MESSAGISPRPGGWRRDAAQGMREQPRWEEDVEEGRRDAVQHGVAGRRTPAKCGERGRKPAKRLGVFSGRPVPVQATFKRAIISDGGQLM